MNHCSGKITEAAADKHIRNPRIDFLRFVFSIIIVLHHTRYLLGYDNCIFAGGSLAVEFFFFVSGYLMMGSAERAAGRVPAGGCAADCGNPHAGGNASTCGNASAGGNAATCGNASAGGNAVVCGNVCAGADLQPASKNDQMSHQASRPQISLGRETSRFLWRKLCGILPEFIIAWFIGFFFISAIRHYGPLSMARLFVNDFWELALVKMSGLFVGGFDGVIWYVSAMFLVMAVLYPLARRFPDMFPRIGAPLTALFLLGYLCRTQGHPRDPVVWTGVVYKGILRTAADLCIGVVCYQAARTLRRVYWTALTRVLLAILEPALYLVSIWYMYDRLPSRDDYFFLLLLAVAVTLTFANVGMHAERIPETGGADVKISTGNSVRRAVPSPVVQHITGALAKFSTALYFSHLYYATNLDRILPENLGRAPRVGIYLLCACGTALFVEWSAAFLRRHKSGIIRWFVEQPAATARR